MTMDENQISSSSAYGKLRAASPPNGTAESGRYAFARGLD